MLRMALSVSNSSKDLQMVSAASPAALFLRSMIVSLQAPKQPEMAIGMPEPTLNMSANHDLGTDPQQ